MPSAVTLSNRDSYTVLAGHLATVFRWVDRAAAAARLTTPEAFGFATLLFTLVMGKILNLTAPQEEINNYFNDKRNLINVFFAKRAWGWTTAVSVGYQALQMAPQARSSLKRSDTGLVPFAIRYVAVTLWWVWFTQWFFGYPIMDKIFLGTGGQCVGITEQRLAAFTQKNPAHPHRFLAMEALADTLKDQSLFSAPLGSVSCRRMGGRMTGGHDPSGHVFLLVQSTLFLLFETLGRTDYIQLRANWIRFRSELRTRSLKPALVAFGTFIVENPVVVVWGVCALWWWMLLMTAIYFHSWLEKLVGLLWGYAAVYAVYVGPRFFAAA